MLDDIEDRHDVGMVHSACCQCLALKEPLRLARGRQRAQNHLQGYSFPGTFIGTRPHRRHSALTEQVINSVLPAN